MPLVDPREGSGADKTKRVNFPASDCKMEEEAAEVIQGLDDWSLFPLPEPERPEYKRRKSARLRTRQKRRFVVWRGAVQLTNVERPGAGCGEHQADIA